MDIFFLSVITYASLSLLILLIFFTIIFVIAYVINIWKILDIASGLGFVIVVLTGWGIFWDFYPTQHLWVVGLVSVWGLRLSIHLGMRGVKKEDIRYEQFKDSRYKILQSYINVFLSQAFFIWLICLPFYFYMPIESQIIKLPINTYILIFGIIISIIGLYWEWVSDFQLKYLKKPGELVKQGLWKYSRHPNYFGEILFWWGIWIATRVAVFSNNSIPSNLMIFVSLISILSPLTITCIINYLTGPILENQMKKYFNWEEYKSTTPYIIPYKLFKSNATSNK